MYEIVRSAPAFLGERGIFMLVYRSSCYPSVNSVKRTSACLNEEQRSFFVMKEKMKWNLKENICTEFRINVKIVLDKVMPRRYNISCSA